MTKHVCCVVSGTSATCHDPCNAKQTFESTRQCVCCAASSAARVVLSFASANAGSRLGPLTDKAVHPCLQLLMCELFIIFCTCVVSSLHHWGVSERRIASSSSSSTDSLAAPAQLDGSLASCMGRVPSLWFSMVCCQRDVCLFCVSAQAMAAADHLFISAASSSGS